MSEEDVRHDAHYSCPPAGKGVDYEENDFTDNAVMMDAC